LATHIQTTRKGRPSWQSGNDSLFAREGQETPAMGLDMGSTFIVTPWQFLARSFNKTQFAVSVYNFSGVARCTLNTPGMNSGRKFFTDVVSCFLFGFKRARAIIHPGGAPMKLIVSSFITVNLLISSIL